MNWLQIISALIVLVGAIIFVVGVINILVSTQRRHYNSELAPRKGSPVRGVLWAFTLGMAPWAKESARIHWVAYIRGIVLHLSIFVGAVFLLVTPWLTLIPEWIHLSLAALFAAGAILGLAGFYMRISEKTLRILSTPDDYFSLALTTLFLASAAATAYNLKYLPAFWIISGIALSYAPLGKLRHFIYFVYTRIFLGSVFGRRSVLE